MRGAEDERELVKGWLEAAARAEVRAELEGVYGAAAEAIRERGPACWASGRCCNFEKTGHLLYVTGLEAAYTVRMGRAITEKRAKASPNHYSLEVVGATSSGACPFQEGNLCGVHEIKPLGCRVYFCDRSAQQWQNELSERLLAEIRAIHERNGIEYRYGEWRGMLRAVTAHADA
jgi:Fe-S-cluster containining protein